MDKYCRKENIFFEQREKIIHSIDKCKGLYEKYKATLNKGFEQTQHFEEDEKLKAYLKEKNTNDALDNLGMPSRLSTRLPNNNSINKQALA